MALTLGTAARDAACNGVVDLVDAGAGPGKLKVQDGGGTVLVEIILSAPAFSPAATGVATAIGLPLTGIGLPAAGTGTAPAKYDVTDGDDVVIWSGTIPSNMTLDSATIANGQAVSVTSWSHTQPAG